MKIPNVDTIYAIWQGRVKITFNTVTELQKDYEM